MEKKLKVNSNLVTIGWICVVMGIMLLASNNEYVVALGGSSVCIGMTIVAAS